MQYVQTACRSERIVRPGVSGRIIRGDGTNPPPEYEGKAQCVYIDPPFNTGERFSLKMRVGEDGWSGHGKTLNLPAYSDQYASREEYHAFLRSLIAAEHRLLNDSGSFFLHLDQRESVWGRLLCDEVFGEENLVNEIIWAYQSGGRTLKRFSAKHDTILFYRKSREQYFDITKVAIRREGNRSNHMKKCVDENGRAYRTIRSGGKVYTYYDDDPVYPGDVWTDVSHLQQKDPQRTGFDTQKPVALLRRIIGCCTKEGDLTADLCCGSGTALAAAAAMDRPFLGMDTSSCAVMISRRRLSEAALTVDMEFGCEGAELEADVASGIGFDEITLTRYDPGRKDRKGIEGLDCVDSWSVGFLKDGIFHTQNLSMRQKHQPAIAPSLLLPQLHGVPAISVTDVWGRSSVWIEK